jgi:hypothetical protein
VLLRLAYLGVTNAFALLRLLPVSDRDKDVEILALRHQIAILERQLGKIQPPFCPGNRVFLSALLHRLPRDVLGRFRLLIRPETVLRWHRDLLVLRLARENPCWVTAASTANCSSSGSTSRLHRVGDPEGAENLCHLGRCSAERGPASGAGRAGLGPSGRAMIFGL